MRYWARVQIIMTLTEASAKPAFLHLEVRP